MEIITVVLVLLALARFGAWMNEKNKYKLYIHMINGNISRPAYERVFPNRK